MLRRALLISLALALLLAIACYGPTQMRIELSTDVACATDPKKPLDALIFIGESFDRPAAPRHATECKGADPPSAFNDLGSLVIVPSGDREARLTVEIALAVDGGDSSLCVKAPDRTIPKNCINARRSFKFISHTARELPIRLSAACIGVSCGDQTCIEGRCHTEDVEDVADPCAAGGTGCEDSGTDAEPVADAKADVLDGPQLLDAFDGAKPPCRGPMGGDVLSTDLDSLAGLQLIGNTWDLFVWNTGRHVVRSISKSGTTSRIIALPSDATSNVIQAIAVDDTRLWVATSTQVHRYKVSSLAVPAALEGTTDLPDTTTMAIGANGVVYLSAGSPATLFRLGVDGTLTKLNGSKGGVSVAANASAAYSLDFNANLLWRHTLPWNDGGAAMDAGVVQPVFVSSFIDGGVYVSADGGIHYVAEDGGILKVNPMVTANKTKQLALFGSKVLFIAADGGFSGVYKGDLVTDGGMSVAKQVTLGTYEQAEGLVVDPLCVYFGAADVGGQTIALRVAPNTIFSATPVDL